MLEPDGEQKVLASEIVPFTDAALRSRRARTRLAARLWASGLLRPVERVTGLVAPFTVVKKLLKEPPAAITDISQRMVLDQRKENVRWRSPPWSPMANPSMFPYLR
eukprot:11223612-Lingulodinium_polyedra.AAC.1